MIPLGLAAPSPSLQGGAVELASYCNAVAAGLQLVSGYRADKGMRPD